MPARTQRLTLNGGVDGEVTMDIHIGGKQICIVFNACILFFSSFTLQINLEML